MQLPLGAVREAWAEWASGARPDELELGSTPILGQLEQLLPFEMPYRRRLFVEVGQGWTAVFDNSRGGGDPFPVVGRFASELGAVSVLATHAPSGQSSLPATQFHLFGPAGVEPLMYVRTIDAGTFDSGRWEFRLSGTAQPFEQPEQYERRLVRDRFTRSMLLDYLLALGVRPDEPSDYGVGVLMVDRADWEPGWKGTLHEARLEHVPAAALSSGG